MKEQKGITLIALIITVIILLILAGTAISIAVNGDSLFGRASSARNEWNDKVSQENTEITNVLTILNSIPDITPAQTENLILKNTTVNDGKGYVGYYADFDGTPGVDGIIYADLLVQIPESTEWGEDEEGYFELPTDVTAANVKDYVVSTTPVTDTRFDSTARYVISPASSGTGTKARFYVMGLDDLTDGTNDTLYWYYSASSYDDSEAAVKWGDDTVLDFGAGKTNTDAILERWDPAGNETTEGTFGNRDPRDMWKQVKTKRTEYAGWYVPSAGEWSAFATAFGLDMYDDTVTREDYGLSECYWSSTQTDSNQAWCPDFESKFMQLDNVNNTDCSVRLGATI